MKIAVPLSSDDVTLDQFCKYQAAKSDLERVMAISGKTRKICEGFQVSTSQELISSFEFAISRGAPKHEQTFLIDGMRLGFIPDLNSISLKEHIDLDTYANLIWKKDDEPDYSQLVELMSILFRPVQGIIGDKYELEEYNGSRKRLHMDRVKQMSMSRVNGALVFFSTIVKESVLDGVESLVEEMKKEMMTEELPSSV
jgi:hypothetical protein